MLHNLIIFWHHLNSEFLSKT